jgi:hypothetical protein
MSEKNFKSASGLDGKKHMEEHEIITCYREELTLETAFTGRFS